ncbi:4'-phosphopantetheinyl transferase superfamily protein [Streptomyces sp. NPDC045431]|uniref:4'-phosphopantetheinyl transferase family protein n=1 Tax=Streptomyces sp. NPDC045431 TaxID=3155613 RepID=UPI0033FB725A
MTPVNLWICPNEELAPGVAGVLARHWLDEHEKQVADRFLHARDRRQYVVAHALVRRALALESGIPEAELVIRRSARGRPFLQHPDGGLPRGAGDLDFNLSHVNGLNLLGTVRGSRIGVDAERLDREERSIDAVVEMLSPEERDWVARAPWGRSRRRRAMRLWTLKEAYSKARGLGLRLPFDTFSFALAENRGIEGFRPPGDDRAGRWRFIELEPLPGVLAAVALQNDVGRGAVLRLHHGFPWGRSPTYHVALPEPVGAPDAYR